VEQSSYFIADSTQDIWFACLAFPDDEHLPPSVNEFAGISLISVNVGVQLL
jgi:hypothetical protein